jgi:hypothetical protein
MEAWLARYWWLVWSLVAFTALVTYRIRRRGGDESLPARVVYALCPDTDPENKNRRQVTPLAFILVAVGMVIVLIAILVVALFNR